MNADLAKPQKPANQSEDEHPELSARNARSGLWLFAVYLAAYAVFIRLAAASPDVLGWITPLGPNLAIVYGFGLIVGAVVLALVYMRMCRRNEEKFRGAGGAP
ncbi:MAG TPA: DUF485 domain-containing protein [Pirellulaceae bacterium]|nr:DUF485 domain-containing protein [Pirellulaceae bacterium]